MTASVHLQYVVGLSVDRFQLLLGMLLTCLAAAASIGSGRMGLNIFNIYILISCI